MNVADFLYEAAKDRGPWNCSTLPADWCVALGHPDFAAKWRGVTEADECTSVPLASGGLVKLWLEGIAGRLAPANFPFVTGDIAVVGKVGLDVGAIFDGERWAFRTLTGLHFARIEDDRVQRAWRP